ncbi:MAG: hypothetical protein K6F61_11925 [Clostridiales bacterium]|nr:hypothetical protein [Clostridiales bacterium]
MTEMTARIRNRLQDGVIDWQERRFRKTDFRQQQADIHRSRMTCSASLPAFHQTQDWTGGLTASGRIPAIEETKPKQRLISSEGIRWDAAIAALIVIGALLLVLLAADLVSIGANGRVITRLNASVQDLEAKNAETQAKIELAAGSSSVCTEAVKLDLISSAGARTIRLTAPVNAQLTVSTAEKAAENAELEGRLTSNAGD